MPDEPALRQLNYHHLGYFRAVAHGEGLTAVAKDLHISPSALSVQIRKLERQLGHPLFERRGRRLLLTDVGQLVLDYADRIFSTGEELLGALQGRGPARVLRVGALSTLSRNFQVGFLRPLLGRDDIHLVLRAAGLRDLIEQLDAHVLDVVLATRALPRDAGDYHCHLLQQQPVSLVGPPGPERDRFRYPEDLDGRPLLLPSLDNALRDAFDTRLSAAGVHPLVRAEVDDMALLRLVARHSPDCLTLVPPVVVRDELAEGTLVEWHRLDDLQERFFAITRSRHLPHPLVADLVHGGNRDP